MDELRLGDIIDDYCIKCRRMTNHAIVSIVEDQVAKVRCRSCYHDHDYLHEQIPPSKKDLKKAEMSAAAAKAEEEQAENSDKPVDPVDLEMLETAADSDKPVDPLDLEMLETAADEEPEPEAEPDAVPVAALKKQGKGRSKKA